jgi:hypothetical protein
MRNRMLLLWVPRKLSSSDIKPKEANDMLVGKWKKGNGAREVDLPDGGVVIPVEIQAVMARH